MNRIILIGNGFDLAHKLKTSYAHFMNWYWYKWGEKLLSTYSKSIDDRLCSFELNDESDVLNIAYVWGQYYRRINPLEPWDLEEIASKAKQDNKLFKFTYKDKFFQEICSEVETKGWVDIETIFYDYLSHKSQYVVDTKTVNDDLDFLRENLIKYLAEIEKIITPEIINKKIQNYFLEPFKKEDVAVNAIIKWNDIIRQRVDYDEEMWNDLISSYFNTSDSIRYNYRSVMNYISNYKKNNGYDYPDEIPPAFLVPDRTMLLNFNYTKTADLYVSDRSGITVNHIHGEISNPDSVIFGYGDELDEHFKSILNLNDNEYLRNIKSYKYLESSKYRDLLKFIESSPYQIFIMGHSCGNSDRTLLNTLFEHKNCVSIKPFYYKKENGTDNYIELVQNISRNFTDMKLMRDRVVNKEYCTTL